MVGLLSPRLPGVGLLSFNQPEPSPVSNALQTGFAALADAGAAFAGRPQQMGQLQQIVQQRRQQDMQQKLLAGLTSPDPAIKQKAEAFAALNGINVDNLRAALGQRKPDIREAGGAIYDVTDPSAPKTIVGPAPKPNLTRRYESGDQIVNEEFVNGAWQPLGKPASRYKPAVPSISGGGAPGIGIGKTINERMQSVLLNGDPADTRYAAAYAYLSQPKATVDNETGQVVTIRQDLSWARPPVRNGKPIGGPQPTATVGAPVVPGAQTDQAKLAFGFAERMKQAEDVLAQPPVEEAAMDLTAKGASKIPVFGNKLSGTNFQLFDQAKRNWINAQLRRESGAVISKEEFANADKQYFPVYGDSPEVLAQKKQNRETAEAAMRRNGTPPQAPITDGSQQQQPPQPQQKPAGAPAIGSVVKGYRFKGGDPSKPQSWEKV